MGYIIYLFLLNIWNTRYSKHQRTATKPSPQNYKNRAATAPTPATKLPTLTLEAAPVNSETGALYAPVPEGAMVPTSEGRGVRTVPVGTTEGTAALLPVGYGAGAVTARDAGALGVWIPEERVLEVDQWGGAEEERWSTYSVIVTVTTPEQTSSLYCAATAATREAAMMESFMVSCLIGGWVGL